MSYNWTTGEVITAEKLNDTGSVFIVPVTVEENLDYDGVENLEEMLATTEVSYATVKAAYDAGNFIVYRMFAGSSIENLQSASIDVIPSFNGIGFSFIYYSNTYIHNSEGLYLSFDSDVGVK